MSQEQIEPKETWKAPHLWTEQEIHDLVMQEVGADETEPRGMSVLVLLWSPPEEDENGLVLTDVEMKKINQSTKVGKILRMGEDAFQDPGQFPSGPIVTYGEWAIFQGSERSRMRKNGKDIALINDVRFIGTDRNPETLQTHFDLQFEFSGQ